MKMRVDLSWELLRHQDKDPRRDHTRNRPHQQRPVAESWGNPRLAAVLPALLGLILVRDGHYPRFLPTADGLRLGVICRKKCPGCRTRFSLLPNDVVPLHSCGLPLICCRLRASLACVPDRNEAFYHQHGLLPDDNIDISWTDRVNENLLSPTNHVFRGWRLKWPRRAQAWLSRLLLACVFAGCDLKSKLATELQQFSGCPATMRALPMAAALVALVQEGRAQDSFQTAVFLLACSPAHKSQLVSGRPPPYYAGDLELSPQLRHLNA